MLWSITIYAFYLSTQLQLICNYNLTGLPSLLLWVKVIAVVSGLLIRAVLSGSTIGYCCCSLHCFLNPVLSAMSRSEGFHPRTGEGIASRPGACHGRGWGYLPQRGAGCPGDVVERVGSQYEGVRDVARVFHIQQVTGMDSKKRDRSSPPSGTQASCEKRTKPLSPVFPPRWTLVPYLHPVVLGVLGVQWIDTGGHPSS